VLQKLIGKQALQRIFVPAGAAELRGQLEARSQRLAAAG
jgi:hypothetical protein